MSNRGLWDNAWSTLPAPILLGGSESYERIAAWLADEPLVEDWGCGPGGLRQFVRGEYRGVDGSASPFADVYADLTEYRPTDAPAIVLKAVLEHNDDWRRVLDNALASFGRRMVIGLFTPLAHETTVLFREDGFGGVPVIAFALADLTWMLLHHWTIESIESPDTAFGHEHLIFIERKR